MNLFLIILEMCYLDIFNRKFGDMEILTYKMEMKMVTIRFFMDTHYNARDKSDGAKSFHYRV
jgi:hypothetical protein